ncbi:MAG: hypothetical protein L0212_09655 [Acidobacteria bacterium]|nr:hypothetical protein [Acidobacteriota bacterium]
MRRLWATGWFDDIRVERSDSPEGVRLVFIVKERPRLYLRRVKFEPESERWTPGTERGAPIDAVRASRVAARLRRALQEDGYLDADVRAELIPVGFQEADLRVRVERGRHYQVEEVRFAGNFRARPEELRRVFSSARVRRVLPGIPGVWAGWRLRPAFSHQRLDADLQRLRSWYLARGFLDATVALGGVGLRENKATVTVQVEAGPRYRVRSVEVAGPASSEPEPQVDGAFPARDLCASLLKAKRELEKAGELDFTTRLEVAETTEPPWAHLSAPREEGEAADAAWLALTARVEASPAFEVRRIEFRGHHSVNDATLRRALVLHEGDMFDLGRLRASLAQLSQFSFLEPPGEDAVSVERDPERHTVDLTLRVQERPRGRWTLSGPLGPASLAGPLHYSIGARLPAWGRGPLELSTYVASFHLLAFSFPALEAVSLLPRAFWLPLVGVERPYAPGQEWQSGFFIAPQLGWRGTVTSYLATQARRAVTDAIEPDVENARTLAVLVVRVGESSEPKPAGLLLCDAQPPRLGWLRTAALVAMNVVFGVGRL